MSFRPASLRGRWPAGSRRSRRSQLQNRRDHEDSLEDPVRAELPLPPHSQDGFLNWQRRVQPAIHVAAVGLVQPEHQRAALGIGFSLEWEGDGGVGPRSKQPRHCPTLPHPSPYLLDGLQHHGGGGHSEGTPGGHGSPAWGGQRQQGEVEAVGCLDNTSILERAWARAKKECVLKKGAEVQGSCLPLPTSSGETEVWRKAEKGRGSTHPRAASARM